MGILNFASIHTHHFFVRTLINGFCFNHNITFYLTVYFHINFYFCTFTDFISVLCFVFRVF